MNKDSSRRNKSMTLNEIIFSVCLALVIIVVGSIWYEFRFPSQFRNLYPEKFDSHEPRYFYNEQRSWQQTKKFVLNQSLVNMCEDIEITTDNTLYCINDKNRIISIDIDSKDAQEVAQTGTKTGGAYGLKLSRDQKLLYFAHTQLGLCQFDIKKQAITPLFSEYKGKPLLSLNSIETHPTKNHIIYVTETSSLVPLKYFNVDLLMNNPLGRVFQFNKKTNKLKLLADGLYFANGVVFQQYDGQETLLVAESNRFRITRIYLSGPKKGQKQVAIDKLDCYLDNMKLNQNGDIWIACPSMRDHILYWADHHPILRFIMSRIPPQNIDTLADYEFFGGLKIKFSNENKKHKVEYFIWQSIPEWKFTTTVSQHNDRLFLSSLKSKGIMVVDGLKKLTKKAKKAKKEQL